MGSKVLVTVAVLVAGWALSAHAAKPPPLLVYETNANGDTRRISDFQIVDAPQFLFRGTKIKREAVELYCSPTWDAVIIKAGDKLFFVNDGRMRNALFDGSDTLILSSKSRMNPIGNHPETINRIVKRAHKQCGRLSDDSAEPSAILPKPLPRGKIYNVINHIAEVKVLDDMCGRLKIDLMRLSVATMVNGVTAEDIGEGGAYHEQLVSMVREKRAKLEMSAHGEDIICMTGAALYGENGVNVPGLLEPE